MQIQSQLQPQFKKDTCFVIGSYSDGKFSALGEKINQLSQGKLLELYNQNCLPSELGAYLYLPALPNFDGQVLWLNLGDKNNLTPRAYQKILQKTAEFLTQLKLSIIYFSLINDITINNKNNFWKTFHAAQVLGSKFYRFQLDNTEQAKSDNTKTIIFETSETKALEQAQAFLESLYLVKNLANLPANICTPTYLANTALQLSKDFSSLKTQILEEADMAKLGMNTLLSVSQGSKQPAKLISIHYNNTDKSQKPIIFIGKGITFDTGGTSIKPSFCMDEMKYDMCGAATVLGLMKVIATLKLPLNIIGLAPCVENMPGGGATRPGDIVKSLSGKTIEILNTDAEGRLILCDTLTYAEQFSPEVVIDLATLTGAAIMTFGNISNALMGNDQNLMNNLLEASEECNERTWQLPLWDEYQEMLKSNFADLPNIHNDNNAKTIMAACYLSRFTEKYSWAHLDIAGTAWLSGKEKGATGRPLLLLLNYLLKKI